MMRLRASQLGHFSILHRDSALIVLQLVDNVVIGTIRTNHSILLSISFHDLLNVFLFMTLSFLQAILLPIDDILFVHSLVNLILHLRKLCVHCKRIHITESRLS